MTLLRSVSRRSGSRPAVRRTLRTRRAALAAMLCAGLVAGAAGCGGEEDPDKGTNGVGKLTATEIEERARTAADAAKAVRLSGTLTGKDGTYKLNMRLKEDGGSGSVTADGQTFELLRIGDDLYLKAEAAFWTSRGEEGTAPTKWGAEAADKLDDKYVKVPKGDPAYQQFRGFTDKDGMLEGFLGMRGELSKGDRTKIGGVRTIKVDAAEGAGGVLDVSLDGAPYPVQFARAGGAGVLTLGEWDVDFPLAPPRQSAVVDYGRDLKKPDGGSER